MKRLSALAIAVASVVAAGLTAARPALASAHSPTAPALNTRPCKFASVTACQSTDPTVRTYLAFNGDTSGCTFNITVNWGDNSHNTNVVLTNPPDGTDHLADHTYRYSDKTTTYTITVSGSVSAGQCSFSGGTLGFTLLACSSAELSGPSWARKFPDSKSVSRLSGGFRADVRKFIAAMTKADISERTIGTLRPAERAYLMHYSWLVAKRQLSPTKVPYFAGSRRQPAVGICWVHADMHGADIAASVAAARKLLKAFGLNSATRAPLLTSLRTEGLAIEMSTTWKSRTVRIVNGAGDTVTIRSTPHSGLNKTLIRVGATYGVIHFSPAARHAYDWSVNGH